MRYIAVDWSGRARGAGRHMYTAEVEDGSLVRLSSGRSHYGTIQYLISRADENPNLIVGLDFAFSLPAWFLERHDLQCAKSLWRLVEEKGEQWLEAREPPFWGWEGTSRPDDIPAEFRVTEQTVRERTAFAPKSPFHVHGPGTVGTGSLRGMPHLLGLRRYGFSIWPFDQPEPPAVLEIYPRLLTGAVTKSSVQARLEYLKDRTSVASDEMRTEAAASDDAFDAAVSALVMAEHADALCDLKQPEDPRIRKLEGEIWWPGRP